MTIRTSMKTVIFRKPFILDGLDGEQPAGAYCVETDEELLEGMSRTAYRRVLTLIHLQAKPGQMLRRKMLSIDPNELDLALKRDQTFDELSADRDGDHMPQNERTDLHVK